MHIVTGAGAATLSTPGKGANAGGMVGPGVLGQVGVYGADNLISGASTIPIGLLFAGPTPWDDVQAYGAKCDGVTDDTAAVNSALAAVYANNGGELRFPPGKTCLILGQITIPCTSGANPTQPSIKITGWGATASGYWDALTATGSTIDMRHNAAVAKIITEGAGILEICGLNFIDGGSDSAAFLFTSNTTLKIHDNSFQGTASAASAVNDGIILGGTDPTTTIGSNAAFQGYGTLIYGNFFSNIRHAVVFQNYSNGSTVDSNVISQTCGNPTGGAFLFQRTLVADHDNGMSGNVLKNNLIEVTYYKYGIEMQDGAIYNTLIGNSCYDAGADYVSAVYMNSGTTGVNHNLVMGGETAGMPLISAPSVNPNNIVLDEFSMTISAPTIVGETLQANESGQGSIAIVPNSSNNFIESGTYNAGAAQNLSFAGPGVTDIANVTFHAASTNFEAASGNVQFLLNTFASSAANAFFRMSAYSGAIIQLVATTAGVNEFWIGNNIYAGAGELDFWDHTNSALLASLWPNGGLTVGLPTGGNAGLGTINTAGAYYANGTIGVTQTAEVVGTLATIGGIVTTFTAVSDERLKVFTPYEGGLKEILSITPIRYRWNETGQKLSGQRSDRDYVGFSAQNAQKSIPESIQSITKDGYLSFDDRPVIAALVNAVKELETRLLELERR